MDLKKLKLNKKDILMYQQNREPYLFIDYANEVIPGKSSKGYKDLRESEWFFKVHWPTDPNMPGMLQIEALVQMASLAILTLPNLKGKILYLVSADKIKFVKKVIPNSKFYMDTKILSFNRGLAKCSGVAKVDNEISCKAEFVLILPELVKKYTSIKQCQ